MVPLRGLEHGSHPLAQAFSRHQPPHRPTRLHSTQFTSVRGQLVMLMLDHECLGDASNDALNIPELTVTTKWQHAINS